MPRTYTREPLEERFWKHVDKTSDCWLWTGPASHGYGVTHVWNGTAWRNQRASRISWSIHFGTIPEGLFVCHHCDVRLCVRPDHLFLGTAAHNTADMIRKGRRADHRRFGDKNPTHTHPEKYQGVRNGRAKLTDHDVQAIRIRYATGAVTQIALAREYGVNQTMIGFIVRRKSWRHLT